MYKTFFIMYNIHFRLQYRNLINKIGKKMRIIKRHSLLSPVTNYVIDAPQPANISYWWNVGSLLGLSLGIQIITGVTLAMHYSPSVLEAFNSVEHIMRDVNNGWLIRYLHSNTASAFFFLVYLHIGRGLYYGSYKAPRTLVWTIGTIILILMMAKNKWPNWMLTYHIKYNQKKYYSTFNKSRTKALHRTGPHEKEVLSIIISGMLGDWWSDEIKGQISPSVSFNIEQSINNAAYIHNLTLYFNSKGYCSNITPKLVKKELKDKKYWFNYRLTLFSFTSLLWIHNSFYKKVNGVKIKVVPNWIAEYLTPVGLAHWIMQDGSRQIKQGVNIATNSFTYDECKFLCNILKEKYNLKCSVVKTGYVNQWSINIWKQSMHDLATIVKPYIINEMKYKFIGYI